MGTLSYSYGTGTLFGKFKNVLVRFLVWVGKSIATTVFRLVPRTKAQIFLEIFQESLSRALADTGLGFLGYTVRPYKSNSTQTIIEDGRGVAIVISGVVKREYDFTLETVRLISDQYPKANIIVTLWPDDLDLKNEFEALGSVPILLVAPEEVNGGYSTNHQIRSVCDGLLFANRLGAEFALRLRADQRPMNPDFISYLKAWHGAALRRVATNTKNGKLRLQGPIVSLEDCAKLFSFGHIPDHFHFGYAADLLALWDSPLRSESAPEPESFGEYVDSTHFVEQYLGAQFVKKLELTKLDDFESWVDFVSSYFVLLERNSIGLFWLRDRWWHITRGDLRQVIRGYPYTSELYLDSNITHQTWFSLAESVGRPVKVDFDDPRIRSLPRWNKVP